MFSFLPPPIKNEPMVWKATVKIFLMVRMKLGLGKSNTPVRNRKTIYELMKDSHLLKKAKTVTR